MFFDPISALYPFCLNRRSGNHAACDWFESHILRVQAMLFRCAARAFALATVIAVPDAAIAQGGGGPGCTNLPEYNRALGALQGMTSACDMSVERACRILAEQGASAAECQQIAPEPRADQRRRR